MAAYQSHVVLITILIFFVSTSTGKGLVGVDYGRIADNLMPPEQVIKLLKDNSISAVRIYDADEKVIRAFSGSGIQLSVSLPNELLGQAAGSADYAYNWVRQNVAAYPDTQIRAIAVGNEVFRNGKAQTDNLFPAMRNIADAVGRLGLSVKVSTPVAFDAITNSFPPSDGAFRDEFQGVMGSILDLLSSTGSPLMMNIYPYFTYVEAKGQIDLDYALGRARTPVVDQKTGLSYYSLLDAQLDAVYAAMDRLGYGDGAAAAAAVATSLQRARKNPVNVDNSEGGWSHGKPSGPPRLKKSEIGGNLNASLAEVGGGAATVQNAEAYNSNLIQRILAGKTGTPRRPNADLNVYIFSLFDENQKEGDPAERSFGLFSAAGTKNYQFSFTPTGYTPTPANPPTSQPTWCQANGAVGRDRLQAALDWACGEGKADCAPLQPGAACFEPNTLEAHATYAFNSYYQQQGRRPSACDFKGAATIVNQIPSILQRDCRGPTWCVSNPGVGRQRLQAALDWACGEGKADCRPIQPGAACFEPNTVEAHASYAFNSYYQMKNRGPNTCNFNGAASIVFQQPQIGSCKLPPR